MNGMNLFIFYLVFWVCGRLYIMADSYYLVKVFHSIGLHFDIFCLIFYIALTSSDERTKLFWKLFLFYESLSIIVFCKTQLSLDHELSAFAWESGLRNSAANKIYGNLGFAQDILIPIFIVLVIYFIYKRRIVKNGS